MLSILYSLLSSSPFLLLRLSDAIGSFPKPLSAAEERRCVELAAAGDENARSRLIEHNLRLVAHIIKKYYTQTDDRDDLISIGTIGLIKGISTYDPKHGARLATYASRCIENEILMYFRSQRKSAGDVSLSEAIDSDSDGNSLSLMDVISVEDNMFEELSGRETVDRLREYLSTALTGRETTIIIMRYGIDGKKPMTQREVAEVCGISRSYVSRIEKRAIEKLREKLLAD